MKKLILILLILPLLANCAYVDGLRHEKDVTPAPPNAVPPPANQSQAIAEDTNTATTNAAKTIAPVTR